MASRGTSSNRGGERARLIAYYYPGWHRSAWKPMHEWGLLEVSDPLFPGHRALDRPRRGFYDDRDEAVIASQIREATGAGIDSFTYFLYYDPAAGYVLDEPLRGALAMASTAPLSIGVTWCLRMPYRHLPIELPSGVAANPRHGGDGAPVSGGGDRLVDIVPPELRDTSVHTFVDLLRPTPRHRPAAGATAPPHVDRTVPGDGSFDNATAGYAIRQVLDFMDLATRNAQQRAATETSVGMVGRLLALTGLADVSLLTTGVLLREVDRLAGAPADEISVQALAQAFGTGRAALSVADIRFLAAIGRQCVDRVDAFEAMPIREVLDALSVDGQRQLSLNQARAVIDGVAADLLGVDRQP